jgi:hypothetical protein
VSDLDFARLVASMRAAQRKYFRTRSYDDLDESKRLEREVDAALKEALEPQKKLF